MLYAMHLHNQVIKWKHVRFKHASKYSKILNVFTLKLCLRLDITVTLKGSVTWTASSFPKNPSLIRIDWLLSNAFDVAKVCDSTIHRRLHLAEFFLIVPIKCLYELIMHTRRGKVFSEAAKLRVNILVRVCHPVCTLEINFLLNFVIFKTHKFFKQFSSLVLVFL